MASISTDKSGKRRIQFVTADGSRSAVYLGRLALKNAEKIKTKIEAIVEAQTAKVSLDNETAAWLAALPAALYGKLEAVGLAAERVTEYSVDLEAFLETYIDSRSDIKDSTRDHLRRARRNLVDFFGPAKPLRAITAGDADEFRRHVNEIMGENSANRTCGRAKQFFRAAVRKKLIPESPFGDMKGVAVKPNRSRDFFVTREMAESVLDACPNNEWRLTFALCRYAGLRCPSEHVRLRWGDVDWERDRMTIHSTKTEHHDGKETRIIPIFPEVKPYLEAAFDQAEPGAEFVITGYRSKDSNLRTQLERIISRAGLEPWPKLFQNLRATRETELSESFPMHVVCEWIGNSETVAKKHYLQVTAEHFQRASGSATQNPTQQASESTRMGQSGVQRKRKNPRQSEDSSALDGITSSPGRTRTYDKPVNSRLLYQLSYRGVRTNYPNFSWRR
jgi:integrase